ncbi:MULTISPECIES: DUF47 domain-containing protein [Halobacterium]|uniref:DUF47 domain-containing protein n=1 Tax=Halobacterium TaxID=2239 RepID=UPI00073E72F4|nr:MULTISPECIES: hypothetical protein [Halobacterium]MCG1003370.1 hypothetical protein [Halobacterium noricense]
MSPEATPEFSKRVVDRTDAYLDRISECVELLSRLVEEYEDGDSSRALVEEIRAVESDCDAKSRRISALVTNTTVKEFGIRNSRMHLNAEQVVRLYQLLDEIPNTAERVAEDLLTVSPARRRRCFRRYREMVDHATAAMASLGDAVYEFVRLLCSATETGSIAGHVEAIRAAETECDSVRNAVVADVFDADVPDPLVYREFAFLFDQLVDAMEDVADQLVLLSSSEQWITAEPENR